MAERKRPSTTTIENESKKIKVNQPMCKYGAKCYRKHPDHLKAYRHPSAEKVENETFDDEPPIVVPPSVSKTTTSTSTVSLMELAESTGEDLLFKVYQMKFPADLFQFWNYCSTLDKENPRSSSIDFHSSRHVHFGCFLDALKKLFQLELVGPFEVLDGALKNCENMPNMHLHYRYFYDTPEFLTVFRTIDESSQFHIGFYRFVEFVFLLQTKRKFVVFSDSPDELPAFVASNDPKTNQRFKICGENLFAAIL